MPGQESVASDMLQYASHLLSSLEVSHGNARPSPVLSSFVLANAMGRRFAVSEYGTTFYTEGTPRYLAVDLSTGASATFGPEAEQAWGGRAFITPQSIGAGDPIRRWLIGELKAKEGRPHVIEIKSVERLRRYCAAELVRSDRPRLFARAVVAPAGNMIYSVGGVLAFTHPDLLPYEVLFRNDTVPQGGIGSGHGRLGARQEA